MIGAADKVDECIDELLNLEEEYLQELADRDEDDRYIPPTSRKGATPKNKPQKNSKVFFVFKNFSTKINFRDTKYLTRHGRLIVKMIIQLWVARMAVPRPLRHGDQRSKKCYSRLTLTYQNSCYFLLIFIFACLAQNKPWFTIIALFI